MKKHIPENPAPLAPTSYKLNPHHPVPFKSKAEYFKWKQKQLAQ